MNVASLELCKELYELSGWEYDVTNLDENLIALRGYSLGYLLRKLATSEVYVTLQAGGLKITGGKYAPTTPHPITPDTNDGLDEVLNAIWNAGHAYGRYLKNIESRPKQLTQAKAALNQYMLDTFMELIGEDEFHKDTSFGGSLPAFATVPMALRNELRDELRKLATERLKP